MARATGSRRADRLRAAARPDIVEAIGHTPLVEIARMSPKPAVRLFAKLEMANPTGSVKDRVAKALIEDLEATGRLGPDSIILEPTSGNTGIALAMIGRRRGYRVTLVMPDNVTAERRQLATLFGAEIVDSPGALGSNGAIALAKELVGGGPALRDAVPVRQRRPTRASTRRPPDPRSWPTARTIDVFVAGLGTGGTLMGVARYLRRAKPAVRVYAAEPLPGENVQGLRSLDEGFVPEIFDPSLLAGKYLVSNRDAVVALRELVLARGDLRRPVVRGGPRRGGARRRRNGRRHDRGAAAGWRLEIPVGRDVLARTRRDGGRPRGRRQLVVTSRRMTGPSG